MSELKFESLAAASALGTSESVFENKQQMMSVLSAYSESLAESLVNSILDLAKKTTKSESENAFFDMDFFKQKRVIYDYVSDEVGEQMFSFVDRDTAIASDDDTGLEELMRQPELTEHQLSIKKALKDAVSKLHEEHLQANPDSTNE